MVQQEEIIEQALEVVAAEPEFMLTKDFRGTWAEHCFEQREEVFSKIYQAYKRNGEPAQMGNPRVVEKVINALKEGTQTVEHTFTITVKFDPVE